MILVGIDDTDSPSSRGTNQLAKALVRRIASHCECISIVRHQLFFDPRIPYTSKNGSASLRFKPRKSFPEAWLINELRAGMLEDFIEGSDPGLCVARSVPDEVREFGLRCKKEIMGQQEARELAFRHGIYLEGLGGTEGGVIGALAAIGLIATQNDGRIVQLGDWPDDLENVISVEQLQQRGVEVRSIVTEKEIKTGTVDIGKHLRPNLHDGRTVLFVQPANTYAEWEAVRLP